MSETCGDTLVLGDDNMGGSCTFRCEKTLGHTGRHRETFPNPSFSDGRLVFVTWHSKTWRKSRVKAKVNP